MMARLRNAPRNTLLGDLPEKEKMKQAIQWLRENPEEAPTTAARTYNIKKKALIKAWQRRRKRMKSTPELHTIKTKPIASHRVDMHTEQTLREWFETEYRPALEATGIRHGEHIHNMDEKGARICVPAGEEVVVPIGIKEMYTGIPE